MISGFTQSDVKTNGIRLSVHQAGEGEPLILLHGYPQNHHCWEKVAPALAAHFHVIIPDLRGYGHSDAPPGDCPQHSTYSKRTMAQDILGMMDALQIERAHILGHDRGGRVAYRFALDHPTRLRKLGIIEIVPTGDFWASWNADLAMKAYHWTFLAQPAPMPETLIGADPRGYILHTLESWTLGKSSAAFSDAALESYLAQAEDPARIHAMCADYRAGATFDKTLDEADRKQGHKIAAPLRFLWAEGGFPAQTGKPRALWEAWATDLTDASCVSGHFAMEEAPQDVLATFLPFFADSD
ncbi:alpha/beta fold hydrolase [Nereida sp. MMG025]|uniref:alpha/beta fold hydrolase n=1 Tax=Nereida sp. MMG025 TaxID=2909981 RepID=UPI001F1DFC9F|nr:alpha/beta hydrolase [Nereida sp. MMG025]MCF6444836.1 alpha/beta hydrolase [Nereida sp. MMG025]